MRDLAPGAPECAPEAAGVWQSIGQSRTEAAAPRSFVRITTASLEFVWPFGDPAMRRRDWLERAGGAGSCPCLLTAVLGAQSLCILTSSDITQAQLPLVAGGYRHFNHLPEYL